MKATLFPNEHRTGHGRVEFAVHLLIPGTESGVPDRSSLLIAGVHEVVSLFVITRSRSERVHDTELVGLLG